MTETKTGQTIPQFLRQRDNIKRLAYLLSEGLNNRQIASELGISSKSVTRWKQHPLVIAELDKLINSKSNKIDETIENNHNEVVEKIKRFADRANENLHQLQQLNLKLFTLLNAKIDTLNADDVPTKLLFSSYKTLVESYKVANEIEAEYLGVDHILKKLEEISDGKLY